ncbi:MBL fold metallo-hydrolase [Paenibacillus sp. JX-17]|uniref:MBL fold metallo-hydrolase n=1 Tax=Paenibacillus lacisoli TaxID=3064525 RepID=A0ABT9CDL3_9BACL|nr:MBL fold metallo-hydrolase [Paenibacillus sp. JX-17]MDO7907321.1 MBL fold metallo-hydrolase [Paenibacillus sp. JX-17]
MDQLIFLGTGDAMGVPRVYCDCEVCTEARKTGLNRRLRSSVRIESREGNFTIDCGPDWRVQMEGEGQRHMQQLLVTHAHFDHIGGLPEWADACRWLGSKGNMYAPAEVLEQINGQFPWLGRQLDMHSIDEGFILAGWHIRGWKVNHGKNGFSYAYRMEKGTFAWAYCSDSIGLNDQEKELLHGLDLLVLGTSFYHETAAYETRSVYDMLEAQELLAEIKPVQTIFTHMSHDVDLKAGYPLADGITLAHRGMKVPLGG